MLRMRRTPRIEQLFPTELPSMHIPNGVSPQAYAAHREKFSLSSCLDS